MVEYAVLVSSIALFSSSLSGLNGTIASKLATSDGVASQQVVLYARAAHASAAGARAAYARAPYERAALRYVYANAWVAGTKHKTACALELIDPSHFHSDTVKAMAQNESLRRTFLRMHLTVNQAATAYERGFLSTCGGP